MALPSTGSIGLNDIRLELGVGGSIALALAAQGNYTPINQDSSILPNIVAPFNISSWRGYDHSFRSTTKQYIGGTFVAFNGFTVFCIANLNTDGSIDTGFNIGAGFSNSVFCTAIQSDGKILLGGTFTNYQDVAARSIIRLNTDGSRDTSFVIGTGFGFTVNSIAIQSDGKILVGGDFTTYQGVAANRIIRLNTDGSRDTSFVMGTGFNNTVNSIVLQSDGKIVVGGNYTTYQGVAANRIIRLNTDGSRDTTFVMGTGINSTVNSIAIQSDGKILAGGFYTTYQGVAANSIIRLNTDGSRDTSFVMGTGFNNTVNSIAIQSDGKILLGGAFATYQGVAANYIIRLNTDGSRDTSFAMGTGFNNTVNSIVLQSDGKILLGGAFITYQGVAANRIIRLNTDGSRDTSLNFENGFNSSAGVGAGIVRTILIRSNGKILVGGTFNTYQGVAANRIIRLKADGSNDTVFVTSTGFDGSVASIVIQSDGKIVVGGAFTTYQGVAASRIIRLNTDGSRDTSFVMGTGFNSTVNSIVIQSDGKIVVGGDFTTYQGVAANRIIRLNTDGSRDTSFVMGTGFNNTVNSIVLQSDGKIVVGGNYTTYQGVAANRIIRLNTDGSRDTSFVMGTGFASSSVLCIVIQSDGKILIGGAFNSYQGISRRSMVRLNTDGSPDTSFIVGTNFSNTVTSMVIQSDGKIIVGGSFTQFANLSQNGIIRLNTDGSKDTSFNIGTGFEVNPNIRSISLDPLNGKILAGGTYIRYQGVTANRMIRLNANASINTNFNIGNGFNDDVTTIAI